MLFSFALKDNKVFNRCFRSGGFCAAPFLTAYYLPNDLGQNRVGISVSKKIGNAVCRNRAKRIIRAAYRLNEDKFPIGFDLVFAVRPGINGLKTQEIEEFFTHRLLRHISGSFDENGVFVGRNRKRRSPETKRENAEDNNVSDKKDG
jgi:ribonuclease P protein component